MKPSSTTRIIADSDDDPLKSERNRGARTHAHAGARAHARYKHCFTRMRTLYTTLYTQAAIRSDRLFLQLDSDAE